MEYFGFGNLAFRSKMQFFSDQDLMEKRSMIVVGMQKLLLSRILEQGILEVKFKAEHLIHYTSE